MILVFKTQWSGQSSTRMGISAPRSLLMYGPPGCSKTMIAKALASESGLNFLSIEGPDLFLRRKILTVHTRSKPLCQDVDLEAVAARTDGYSGAEIAAVCNEAALAALEENAEASEVNEKHFDVALSHLKPRISKDLLTIYAKFQSEQQASNI